MLQVHHIPSSGSHKNTIETYRNQLNEYIINEEKNKKRACLLSTNKFCLRFYTSEDIPYIGVSVLVIKYDPHSQEKKLGKNYKQKKLQQKIKNEGDNMTRNLNSIPPTLQDTRLAQERAQATIPKAAAATRTIETTTLANSSFNGSYDFLCFNEK